jgi:hypothetical protein
LRANCLDILELSSYNSAIYSEILGGNRDRGRSLRLRIKNWKTFQHYDHRCPPWIKLHFKILSSRDWVSASDSERVLAIACMLVASQDEAKDGSFDADPEYIQRVAYLHTAPDFNPLINRGFLETLADASACKQKIPNGVTEKSRDREEEETEESDGGEIVLKVLQAYPNCKYKNEMEIPPIVAHYVKQAINWENGQWWLLEAYAKAYADSKPESKYVMGPEKFFSDPNKYRKEWGNGDKQTGRYTELLNSLSEVDTEPSGIAGTGGGSKGPILRI